MRERGKLSDSLLPPNAKEKLEAVFVEFDLDGNGLVSNEEVLEKFDHSPEEGAKVAELFKVMDADGNGSIDRTEFFDFWKLQVKE